jgi:2-oxoglutarate ferredoxin oxidoreductase subunit beta
MKPKDAVDWVKNEMVKVFPPGVFKEPKEG